MRFLERNWPTILVVWLIFLISVVTVKLLFLSPSSEPSFTVEELLKGIRQNDTRLLEYIHGSQIYSPSYQSIHHTRNISDRNSVTKRITDDVSKILHGKKGGFFMESRAYDGDSLSRTLELEVKYEWTGILIEPDPYLFPTLISKRRKAWMLNGCLSPDPIAHNLDFLRRINHSVSKSTEADKDSDRPVHRDSNGQLWKKLTVPCFPLFSITSALAVSTIDFLVLDTQGLELQILVNIPWESITIQVISVNVQSTPEGAQGVKQFMKSKGYVLVTQVGQVYTFAHRRLNHILKAEFGE